MPCRVQRYRGRSEGDTHPVVHRADSLIRPQARLRNRGTRTCDNVARAAVAQVVAMSMSDHGCRHRFPRIDVEVARRAIQAVRGYDHQGFGI